MFVRTKPFYDQSYEHDAIKVRNIPPWVLISDKPRLGARKQILWANSPFSFLVASQTNVSLHDDSCDWTEPLNRDNPWSHRRFFYRVDVSSEYSKLVIMLWMQTNTKTNNGLIHITMREKVKNANMLKMPFIFLEQQIFIFESEDSACPRDREVNLIRQKNVRENKVVLWLELWAWCNKGEKYSFMYPNFG